jgi:hypothetical protein
MDAALLGRVAADPALWSDFEAICDLGGRVAGSLSEAAAIGFLKTHGAAATGSEVTALPVPYRSWSVIRSGLSLVDGGPWERPCHPLIRSVATPLGGLEAEVVDIGRGTQEEFDMAAALLPGRIALVRHEYMFASGHLHRRQKYDWAFERGAAGFLIAGQLPGGALVAGSCGRTDGPGIPAAGISLETAARLKPRGDRLARVRLVVQTDEGPGKTETLLFDMPGRTKQMVVLSAHVDGHGLAESAMDNGTGIAVALAVARAMVPLAGELRRGLRLAFFSVEEWALTGSQAYVAGLAPEERERIALNVNLDSVAGSSDLTALVSGFPALAGFVRRVGTAVGLPLGTHLPLMANSDHYNFARAGIPALRLVAGFDDPASNLRHVLTSADTRDKVGPGELRSAALATAGLIWAACTAPDADMAALRLR